MTNATQISSEMMKIECYECGKTEKFAAKDTAVIAGWRHIYTRSENGKTGGEDGWKLGSTHGGYCSCCAK